MTHPGSGNPTWKNYPDTSTPVTAASLEAIEGALDSLGGEQGRVTTPNAQTSIAFIAPGGSPPASPTAFDHAFTTSVTGKITIRQLAQFAPQTGQGTANVFKPAPALAGIELVRASDGTVLASDRNWSETSCYDTGLGTYGLAGMALEVASSDVLAPGNYLARFLCFSVQYSGGPRVFVKWVKTMWQVVG